MTQAEPTPPAGRPDPLSAHRAPPSYQAPGLIPPGGPARTWGLVVIATPLLLAVLIALIGGLAGGSSGSSSGASGAGYDSGLFGSGTSGSDTSGSGTSGSDDGGTAGTDDQPAYTDPTTAPAWPYGDTTTSGATATDGSYGDPTDTATAAPSASPTAPGDVVTAYFAAISSHDYETAWGLGGKNLDPSYDSFVSGYATTEQDTVTVESVAGDQVQVTIEALQTDGTTKSYDATYTVRDGVITSGTATQTG
ncbi:hypothetical protein ACWCYL_09865 [Streptomyces sp. 900105755]